MDEPSTPVLERLLSAVPLEELEAEKKRLEGLLVSITEKAKTDLEKAKTDLETTKTDLETTKTQIRGVTELLKSLRMASGQVAEVVEKKPRKTRARKEGATVADRVEGVIRMKGSRTTSELAGDTGASYAAVYSALSTSGDRFVQDGSTKRWMVVG